jgi:uncharacterized membrane protein
LAFFNFFTKKPASLLSSEQEAQVVEAIRQAEQNTSGEIRVFIESKCRMVDPLDRAAELFYSLKMDATAQRNAVLVYIALNDRQLALYADEGIYAKAGCDYWKNAVKDMLLQFKKEDYTIGLCNVVTQIGQTLKQEFPYQRDDKNELPDTIVFGS